MSTPCKNPNCCHVDCLDKRKTDPKCPKCNKPVQYEDWMVRGSRVYHPECYTGVITPKKVRINGFTFCVGRKIVMGSNTYTIKDIKPCG